MAETKAKQEEPKLTLPTGHPQAGYLNPTRSEPVGGGVLPADLQKEADEAAEAEEKENQAVLDAEDKAAREALKAEEKAAADAEKAAPSSKTSA